jgi:hypothetical protein
VAEAVAAERERVIQTQAMALRMLEASAPVNHGTDETVDTMGKNLGSIHVSDKRAATPQPAPDETHGKSSTRWSSFRRLVGR